ncbi:MAG: hypothetical protein ACJ71Y_21825 [Blastococcus sp.]
MDPVDGASLLASGMPNALARIAIAERGATFDPRDRPNSHPTAWCVCTESPLGHSFLFVVRVSVIPM